MNVAGFNPFKMPQLKNAQPMQATRQPEGMGQPQFSGASGSVKGNLLSPAVGGANSPVANRLNIKA